MKESVNQVSKFAEKNKKLLVIFLIAGLLFVFGVPAVFNAGNILQAGPEGVRALNIGVQFKLSDSVIRAASQGTMPAGFAWIDPDPGTMVIGHVQDAPDPFGGFGFLVNSPGWWAIHDDGKLVSEIQRPAIDDNAPTVSNGGDQTINYYKQTSQGIEQFTCSIKTVDFVIQISCQNNAGLYIWNNTRLWYALDTVTWQNAFPTNPATNLANNSLTLTSSAYRGAYPIIAWVKQYDDGSYWTDAANNKHSGFPTDNAQGNIQLYPSLQGRFIDLYSAPSSTYNPSLGSSSSTSTSGYSDQQLQDYLKPNALPDPRLSQTVYFPITLSTFGPYVQPTGLFGSYTSYTVWYPAVAYHVRVVYAVYGDYVYQWNTKNAGNVGYDYSDNGTWQVRTTTTSSYTDPVTGFVNGLGKALSDFFNSPMSFFWILIILGGIFLAVLLLVPGLGSAIGAALPKRKACDINLSFRGYGRWKF